VTAQTTYPVSLALGVGFTLLAIFLVVRLWNPPPTSPEHRGGRAILTAIIIAGGLVLGVGNVFYGLGIWPQSGGSSPAGTLVSGCDPSYPTVCIPPPPPYLNCGDIAFTNFQVLPPDPHRFDGDHDGIGCDT
jgi:hypothetical protein